MDAPLGGRVGASALHPADRTAAEDADGSFDGVIVTTFDAEEFLKFLGTVDVGQARPHLGPPSDRRRDLQRARGRRQIGQSAAGDPVLLASRDKPAGGSSPDRSRPAARYISAYQTLGAPPPVVVSVSLQPAEILAEWRTQPARRWLRSAPCDDPLGVSCSACSPDDGAGGVENELAPPAGRSRSGCGVPTSSWGRRSSGNSGPAATPKRPAVSRTSS